MSHIPFRRTAKINDGLGDVTLQDWSIWADKPINDGQLALLVLDGILCALHLVSDDIIKSNDDAYNISNDLGFL